jgi:hypothetical protein
MSESTQSMTEVADGYNHEPVRSAELDGLSLTRAAEIAGNLGLTSVESISYNEGGEKFTVRLTVDGGFTAFGGPDSRYAIKSVTGRGSPETISLHIVEKRV